MKVVIFCKNGGSDKNVYRAGGLVTNALHSVAVLKTMGVDAEIRQVANFAELAHSIEPGVDMAIIEAIWVTAKEAETLADTHPTTAIVVRAHSKMGFLQVEPEAIPPLRAIATSDRINLHFSSNNAEFANAIREVYGPCLYLPNLYDVASAPKWIPGTVPGIKIASFGATRLLKLHPNAALAALQVAHRLNAPLFFYINSDKTPGGESVRRTIANLLKDRVDAKLVEIGWQDSQEFRKTIAGMDLVIQASCTETFCMVAADAVASGVPVVAGPAISWLPQCYQAPIDDTSAMADAGVKALSNAARTRRRELSALKSFVEDAKRTWARVLNLPRPRGWLW